MLGAALAVALVFHAVGNAAEAGVGFFYAVPVGLATWWFGPRAGAAAAVLCTGLFALNATIGDVDDAGVAVMIRAIAYTATWLLISAMRRQQRALRDSVGELEAIRSALTPPDLPELPGVDAAAAFVPSEHGVSGDFYLLTNGPDGSTVAVVGDVVGHGIGSARLATFVRASLASFAANSSDPAQVLMLANRALVDRAEPASEFVTAVCVSFDPRSSTLSWAVAGHPVPLRLPNLDELPMGPVGLPLGIDPDLELPTSHAGLAADEGVLIYTDGVTEARRGGLQLGPSGLRRLLQPLVSLPANELVSRAQRAIVDFTDAGLRDDLCMLVLRPKAN